MELLWCTTSKKLTSGGVRTSPPGMTCSPSSEKGQCLLSLLQEGDCHLLRQKGLPTVVFHCRSNVDVCLGANHILDVASDVIDAADTEETNQSATQNQAKLFFQESGFYAVKKRHDLQISVGKVARTLHSSLHPLPVTPCITALHLPQHLYIKVSVVAHLMACVKASCSRSGSKTESDEPGADMLALTRHASRSTNSSPSKGS
ncbi:hypothetical protein E2C01_004389 [Portunus trituberculatus]|uniref:Uncharacterized protein n=1 Tax=Portunus trituberculatus TaxID=210409 RepID=A0A5B7CR96_PORTR|nr:hypothetical protein [Portunus trituberculatus]